MRSLCTYLSYHSVRLVYSLTLLVVVQGDKLTREKHCLPASTHHRFRIPDIGYVQYEVIHRARRAFSSNVTDHCRGTETLTGQL